MQPGSTISSNLKKAQKNLKQTKREADKLRQNHLDALLNQAIAANQQKIESFKIPDKSGKE